MKNSSLKSLKLPFTGLLLMLGAAAITACGDDDDDNGGSPNTNDEGSSSFVISGDQEGTASGTSNLRNAEVGFGSGQYRLTLNIGAPGFGAIVMNSGLLDAPFDIQENTVYVLGTFGDVDLGEADLYVAYMTDDFNYLPVETEGTLEFSDITVNRAEGVFEFSLSATDNFAGGEVRSVTVTDGTFSAVIQ